MKLRFSARAYTKMLLHASKYPHKAVNGVLLGDEAVHGGEIFAIEAVPLFHICLGLAPMLEIALAQVNLLQLQLQSKCCQLFVKHCSNKCAAWQMCQPGLLRVFVLTYNF